MPGATQAALGIAELSQRTFSDLNRTIQAAFQTVSEANKFQGDIQEGMIRSALAYREQEANEYFRTKALELDVKKQSVNEKYLDLGYQLDTRRVELAEEELDVRRDQLKVEEELKREAEK